MLLVVVLSKKLLFLVSKMLGLLVVLDVWTDEPNLLAPLLLVTGAAKLLFKGSSPRPRLPLRLRTISSASCRVVVLLLAALFVFPKDPKIEVLLLLVEVVVSILLRNGFGLLDGSNMRDVDEKEELVVVSCLGREFGLDKAVSLGRDVVEPLGKEPSRDGGSYGLLRVDPRMLRT